VRLCEPVSVQLEPVSGTPKRKSENGVQRLTPEIHPFNTENLENADQRAVSRFFRTF
jgi:hypothetical protein